MNVRKNRLLQVLFTLMLVTVALPILFNVFISRAYQSAPYGTTDPSPDPFPLYTPQDQRISDQLSSLLDLSNNNASHLNLTSLILARQNHLRPLAAGNSLEEQIAYGFADLTNRLRFAEMGANERRQEINQLMKEIRYLWSLIQKQSDSYNRTSTLPNTSANSSLSLKDSNTIPNQSPPFSITSNEFLNLPSIFSLMPYMHLTAESSINPIFRIAPKASRTFRFVFGIPTVKRTVESYLISTLQNLIRNLNPAEKNQACFVVLVAETDIDFVQQTADDIVKHFPREIKSGLIEIISPPPSFYPNMTALKQTLGDSMERVRWRSKQNLDYAYLMMYCQSKGIYYVQLEDDIITKPSYLTKMQAFITKHTLKNKDWIILDFCSLGFIGKTFKSADLSKLILFFVMFYNDKPVDWLLDNFIDTKMCSFDLDKKGCKRQKEHIWIQYKPSLFQHVGTHSSLKGKIQKLRDKAFGKVKLFEPHEDNPEAKTYTTLQEYKHYKLVNAYEGQNFFWGFSPVKDDLIGFNFNKPINLERCIIRSGNPEHPGDILQNATLQIKPSRQSLSQLKGKYSISDDGFVNINSIVDGFVDYLIPNHLNPIEGIRLKYYEHCTHWVILSEIYFKQLEFVLPTTIGHAS